MAGRVLAAAALLLAVAGVLAESCRPAGDDSARASLAGPGAVGVAELTAELEAGEAFVDAVTLGEWIRDRRPLRILDVQDSSAHVRFSIPTARHVTRRALLEVERTDQPIVVYGDGTGEAARAWLLLRRLGHPRVHVLERGVGGWIDRILEPVLPAGTPAQRAAYERVAAVSRYFGGFPRVGEPPERERDPREAVRLLSRRGCY